MTLHIAVIILAVVAVAAGVWWRYRSGTVRSRLRNRAIVTLKSGETFSGVLFEADRTAFVLRNAEMLGVGENRGNLTVDGELVVLAGDVAYIQMA